MYHGDSEVPSHFLKLMTDLEGRINTIASNNSQRSAGCGRPSLPDLSRTVPSFSGRETHHVAEDWVDTVDGLAGVYEWPFPYRLQFVRANLVAAARNWFLTEQFDDWADFSRKFRDTFVPNRSVGDKWEEMRRRTQGRGEHIVDYFFDKVRLCKSIPLPFEDVREQVIEGIRSRQLCYYAHDRVHGTQKDLLLDLLEWERFFDRRSYRVGNVVKSNYY